MSLLLLLRGRATVSNSVAPNVVGSPVAGQSIVVNNGTWTGTPTFTYQWQSSPNGTTSWTNVSGATGQAYTVQSADVGRYLRAAVTGTGSNVVTVNTAAVGPITTPIVVVGSVAHPSLAALFPAVILELDFPNNGTWTDVSSFVAAGSISVAVGRSNALDRVEAGTLAAPLRGDDRRFEPEYPGSPYYPNVLPGVGTRFSVVYNNTLYRLHRGSVRNWPLDWPDVKRQTSQLDSVDAMGTVASTGVTQVFAGPNLTGTLINAVLDAIGVTSSNRSVDAGAEQQFGLDAHQIPALSIIQDYADNEVGLVYVNGSGVWVFHDRDHRALATRSTVTQAVFGDGGPASGELPYLRPAVDFSIDRVYNDVQVSSGVSHTPAFPQIAQDAPSVARYGKRTLARQTLLSTDAAAADQAARILAASKDPKLRITSLTLDPSRDARLWPVVLGLSLSDRVGIIRRPYAGGTPINRAGWVEGIRHDITISEQRKSWVTTLSLTVTDVNVAHPWVLDSPTYSVLDTTTILA